MGPEFLQIRLGTDVEEMEDGVQIPKAVHDRCTGQTPSVDRVEVERCFGSSSGLISDHVSFVQDDSVPEYLEERTCLISLDHMSHHVPCLRGSTRLSPPSSDSSDSFCFALPFRFCLISNATVIVREAADSLVYRALRSGSHKWLERRRIASIERDCCFVWVPSVSGPFDHWLSWTQSRISI